MNFKVYILNFSNYLNKKYSKFTSNFVDDKIFPISWGNKKGGMDKRFYDIII